MEGDSPTVRRPSKAVAAETDRLRSDPVEARLSRYLSGESGAANWYRLIWPVT